MNKIITTKKELAEYLAEHDPVTLEFFKDVAREFGPAEMVAYVRGPTADGDGERHGNT